MSWNVWFQAQGNRPLNGDNWRTSDRCGRLSYQPIFCLGFIFEKSNSFAIGQSLRLEASQA